MVLYRSLVCCAVVALTAAAGADDLAPPPFRGLPHSVMAKFDLFGGPVPGGPDTFNSVGGIYPLDPGVTPGVGVPQDDPSRGAIIYPIGLPNFIDPLPLKLIRVQYSWFGNPTGPIGDAVTDAILPSPGGSFQLVNSSGPQQIPGSNIFHRWDDFEIIPNPDSERFEIAFIEADPRWVIIDTISLPEPMGIVLAGMAGLLCFARSGRRGA